LILFESPWADFSGQEVLLVVVVVLSCNRNKAWRDYIKRRRKVWQHHVLPSSDSNSILICTSVVLGGSLFFGRRKNWLVRFWVYETRIDNGYNKIKQPPNTGLHIAKCEVNEANVFFGKNFSKNVAHRVHEVSYIVADD